MPSESPQRALQVLSHGLGCADHWPGLTPTSSRKRRVNVRTDMDSRAAVVVAV
jgi:hypothetical protein